MTEPFTARCALALGVFVVAMSHATGCTTHRRARLDLAPDERGVVELTDLLEQFKKAGRHKDFDSAYSILDELEAGIANADTYTSSHPEFEDLAHVAELARPALDTLAERDRRARRAAAIADLLEKLGGQLESGRVMVARILERPPRDTDVDALDDVDDAIEDLEDEGEDLRDDPRYAEALGQARPLINEIRERLAQAEWALDAADDLRRPIQLALTTERKARAVSGLAERISGYEVVVRELERCVDSIERMRSDDDYTNEIEIHTALGDLSIEETAFNCRLRSGTVAHELARARWSHTVVNAAKHMHQSRRHLAVRGTAQQRLAAVASAIAALQQCHVLLKGTESHPGYDGNTEVAAPVGRISAVQMRATCRREATGLASRAAELTWEVSFARVGERAREARAHAVAAKRAPEIRSKVEFLSLAVGGYGECAERARHLAESGNTMPSVRVASPFGRVTVKALTKHCGARRHQAEKWLRQVMRASKRTPRAAACRARPNAKAC